MHLKRRGSFDHFRGTEQKSPKCREQYCLFKLRSTTVAGECKTREWSGPSRNFYVNGDAISRAGNLSCFSSAKGDGIGDER